AGIATEKGDVATVLNERVDARTHVGAPVFVVSYTKQQAVIREKVLRVFVDVEVGAIVCRVAITLQPTDERGVPVRKGLAWRRAVVGIRYVDAKRRSSRTPSRAAQGDFSGSSVQASTVRVAHGRICVVIRLIGEQGHLVEDGRGFP